MSAEKIKILQAINKNVHSKKWNCMSIGCNNDAIKSHLLQKNGTLSLISLNSHVVELVENDYFKIYNGERTLVFKKNSLNKVMCHPLFCNRHDTSIFRTIEVGEIDFHNHETQRLFLYRSLCGELWKKKRNLEFYQRMEKSNRLRILLSSQEKEMLQQNIESHALGISDLIYYKEKIENAELSSNSFTFKTFEVPFLEVCGAGVFSPISSTESYDQAEPFPIVLISLIPYKKSLFIILGKSNEYTNNWIESYFKSWNESYPQKYQQLISDLIATRIESWAISLNLFESWKPEKLGEIEGYWNINRYNLYTSQKFYVNMFD
ncbi:hypothetical protein CLV31_11290 [Algoriphagus aquaeductus]|uniref:Uncharacterized protein n=1 Tax=Algoriphagus aquaeductus TaxID=475299 RepID=A0A326RP23_9BACT|nr:hypothetical protein [Algoriphagus aquaeductus]PZV80323.1 hypothetical protein CLV31_11290 [Algoriphagus aquaeductus]